MLSPQDQTTTSPPDAEFSGADAKPSPPDAEFSGANAEPSGQMLKPAGLVSLPDPPKDFRGLWASLDPRPFLSVVEPLPDRF